MMKRHGIEVKQLLRVFDKETQILSYRLDTAVDLLLLRAVILVQQDRVFKKTG